MNPLFLFEGPDHSGKTSTAKRLAAEIGAAYMHNPPEEIRQYRQHFDAASHESSLVYYAYGNMLIDMQLPELLAERPVVLDRHFFTTVAYHTPLLGRNLDNILQGMTCMPDRIYFCTGDAKTLRARTHQTGEVRQRFDAPDAWAGALANYERLLTRYGNVVRLDSTKMTLDEMFAAVSADAKTLL